MNQTELMAQIGLWEEFAAHPCWRELAERMASDYETYDAVLHEQDAAATGAMAFAQAVCRMARAYREFPAQQIADLQRQFSEEGVRG